MPDLKIVLAVQSKLLRDMLSRVFSKLKDFIIIQEIENTALLAKILDQKDIDWVLFSSMHLQGRLKKVTELIRSHPTVCFADIALDKNEVIFSVVNYPDSEVSDLSLEDFIAILEAGCLCQTNNTINNG